METDKTILSENDLAELILKAIEHKKRSDTIDRIRKVFDQKYPLPDFLNNNDGSKARVEFYKARLIELNKMIVSHEFENLLWVYHNAKEYLGIDESILDTRSVIDMDSIHKSILEATKNIDPPT